MKTMTLDAVKLAKDNENLTIEMRRALHQIPELELELPETVAYVKRKLDEFGIAYRELINGNALVATIYGAEEGKCLAIRADMDALPVTEETGLEFASTHPGNMHACGHDSHTAIALTVAKILNEHKDALHGAVKFIFQPGEEIPGGAKPMIDEGALENPRPDYIMGMHGGSLIDMPRGSIGFKDNELMASMDRFSITVKGIGGHGANPQKTVDPIIIAGEILLGLQKIISRELSPVDRALVSVCKIEGGSSQNIIPDEVHMLGTARTLNETTRDMVERRIGEIASGIATTYGGSATTVYERFYPVLNNDPEFTHYVKGITSKLYPDDIVDMEVPTMGGEDMAFYLREIPGTFMFLSNLAPAKDGVCYPNHNAKFDLDESTFYKSVSIFVATALDMLKAEVHQ
ncbi:amidohydrolase [Peptoniphilus equinus]|uniref:Amidohydrolase n=1 Tax=Peptoniphilus equinus TaxID=3016343 RepID=A0ABY7QUX1_9FIRM|nr:amidohydrolase [Peptoniphilus equinus]WBW50517.1 amidohydrolase [Peptoniphilus equinus]